MYGPAPAPGSPDWFRWFQDRLGTQPMDANTGSIATDFDMVFAFKTLPTWWEAMGPVGQPKPFTMRQYRLGAAPGPMKFNEYTGAPLKSK